VFLSSALFPIPFTNLSGSTLDGYATANHIIQVNKFNPAEFSQTNVASNFYNPYAEQWSMRWQREIGHNQVLEARYVGTHGVGLFATENGNPYINNLVNGFSADGFTFPGFGTKFTDGAVPVTNGAIPQGDGREFDENLVRTRDNVAQSIYHSLQVRYQARVFNQLSVGANYTFSKALDNASEIFAFTETPVASDPFDLKNERGYSGFDRPNAMSINFIWDIPIYRNQEGVLGHLAGGWQLNGVYQLADGQRYTPNEQFSFYNGLSYGDFSWDANFIGNIQAQRPFVINNSAPASSVAVTSEDAVLLGFALPKGIRVSDNVFLSMNALNATGTAKVVPLNSVRFLVNGPAAADFMGNPFGDATRNSLQGPIVNNLNLGLFKNIRLRESMTLQLRLEAFNALNHPDEGPGSILFNGTLTPDTFVEDAGKTALGSGFANNGNSYILSNRVVQVGVKMIF
ncbi:MAG TPA: hypothetical protein VI756_02645, partial [Blastocatellia bacterium]